MVEPCRICAALTRPAWVDTSRVITWIGDDEVNSLRRIREPVTTSASTESPSVLAWTFSVWAVGAGAAEGGGGALVSCA